MDVDAPATASDAVRPIEIPRTPCPPTLEGDNQSLLHLERFPRVAHLGKKNSEGSVLTGSHLSSASVGSLCMSSRSNRGRKSVPGSRVLTVLQKIRKGKVTIPVCFLLKCLSMSNLIICSYIE